MDPVAALPPLREVISRHGLAAKKAFGQHFLLDLNLTRRIARSAGDLAGATVIEVGPGPGGLTRALLLEGAERLVALEKDRRCLAALADLAEAADGRLELREADALSVDLATLGPAPRIVVANLPYNISTALLTRWLTALAQDRGHVDQLVLMFQSEVADRLVAQPGTKSYGCLSVLTQWLCDARPLFRLPASAFTPPPKVDSTVIGLLPHPGGPLAPARPELLQKVTAAGFGKRRKMLRQSLKGLDLPAAELLSRAGISETRRAEELEVADFCRLARILETGS